MFWWPLHFQDTRLSWLEVGCNAVKISGILRYFRNKLVVIYWVYVDIDIKSCVVFNDIVNSMYQWKIVEHFFWDKKLHHKTSLVKLWKKNRFCTTYCKYMYARGDDRRRGEGEGGFRVPTFDFLFPMTATPRRLCIINQKVGDLHPSSLINFRSSLTIRSYKYTENAEEVQEFSQKKHPFKWEYFWQYERHNTNCYKQIFGASPFSILPWR